MLILTLIYLASGTISKPFHLNSDIPLTTKNMDVDGKSFNSVGLYFTKGSSVLLDFDINLNSDRTAIADALYTTGGINCNAANDCEVVSQDLKFASNYAVQYSYKDVKAYIRPSQDSLTSMENVEALKIRLVEQNHGWKTPDWASAGFGPQGDLANYLRGLYEENFKILFYFKRVKGDESTLKYKNYAFVAPTIEKKSYMDKLYYEPNNTHWKTQVSVDLGTDSVIKDANTCLTNFGNYVLYFTNPTSVCKIVQNLVCDGKVGAECTQDVADLSKAPILNITIQEKLYPINPDQYIWNNGGVVSCRFGSVDQLIGSVNCAPATTLGISKGFFEVYVPIFEFRSDGGSAIILLKDYVMPQGTNNNIWVAIVGVAAAAAFGVLVYMAFFRKTRDSDQEIYLISAK